MKSSGTWSQTGLGSSPNSVARLQGRVRISAHIPGVLGGLGKFWKNGVRKGRVISVGITFVKESSEYLADIQDGIIRVLVSVFMWLFFSFRCAVQKWEHTDWFIPILGIGRGRGKEGRAVKGSTDKKRTLQLKKDWLLKGSHPNRSQRSLRSPPSKSDLQRELQEQCQITTLKVM